MRSLLEKQRNILDFTLSSLWRRKARSATLIVVYTLVVFGLASVMLFTQALKREATLILKGTPEIIVQKMVAGRHDLIPLSYTEKIVRIRGVESAKARLWGYYYDPGVKANYTFMAPEGYSLGNQEIVVGAGVSRTRRALKGSFLAFRSHDGRFINFRVKGVLSPESELISSDLILISDSDFRKLFGISGGYATDLIVKVLNKKEISTVATKISQIFPDSRPITREEILRTYDAIFDWRAGIILVVLAGGILAFLIFAWDKATGMSAEERREIGILKATGWETAEILQMKFWEGLTVSLSAFLLGLLFAYVHVFFTSAVFFKPVLMGWSVLYPEFRLTPSISLYQIGSLLFFTVVPYSVATLVPAWRAATIEPDSVMRT